MFRQIGMHPDDMHYQCIVWRSQPDAPVKRYRLRTVTYGTACAPYMAMRVLLQLADDEGVDLTEGAEILRTACYVDDILFGSNEISTARLLKDQLITIMSRGGFRLRKWAANDIALLTDFAPDELATRSDHVLDETFCLKVLGLSWHPIDDTFRFQVTESSSPERTKRSVLSFIARLFDPLGWAAPVIISAKILLQDLWSQNLEWDEFLPSALSRVWDEFLSDFSRLSEIRILRWTGLLKANPVVELHGFSDASQRAYSALVYLQILHSPDDIAVTLLLAKSRVAPLKTVAIPRLEWNGAVLIIRLLDYVQRVLKLDSAPIYSWTDSAITLAWISQHPSR